MRHHHNKKNLTPYTLIHQKPLTHSICHKDYQISLGQQRMIQGVSNTNKTNCISIDERFSEKKLEEVIYYISFSFIFLHNRNNTYIPLKYKYLSFKVF
jgi:hypothetical protein